MNADQRLLKRAKRFDPDALATLHDRFYKPVYRYVAFKVGDRHTSEDLTCEVFVRVLEALKRGKGWHTAPNAWIFGIARNVVADHYRRGRTEVTLDENLVAPAEHDPAYLAARAEEFEALMVGINTLTDTQRDVILLRFIEGLSIKSVAEAMHKTPGAVKVLQYRALGALSKTMQFSSDQTRPSTRHDV